jgi:regulator of protease activity HflC (stomatin/prohibitin superfamily)
MAKVVGFLIILLLLVGCAWFVFSSNPVTPAGYIGYITQGSVLGQARFVKMQMGPGSPSRGWLYSGVNVSITPYTYSEPFTGESAILAKDNLKLQFQAHMLWQIDSERAQEFFEKYSTLEEGATPDKIAHTAYRNRLQEPFRTKIRDEIQALPGLDVKQNINSIGAGTLEAMRDLVKDMPFKILGVVVGNIQYPDEVSNAVAAKLAKTQLYEQKLTEIAIEGRDKEKRIIQAQGIAEAMNVINQRLTPAYLQHEAIEAQKAMVNSPNHSTIYIPVGPMGVPIAGTFDITGPTVANALTTPKVSKEK